MYWKHELFLVILSMRVNVNTLLQQCEIFGNQVGEFQLFKMDRMTVELDTIEPISQLQKVRNISSLW